MGRSGLNTKKLSPFPPPIPILCPQLSNCHWFWSFTLHFMGMSLGFLDETLPNSLNEKTPIQNQNGRNNKKRPMSNQGITPKKM